MKTNAARAVALCFRYGHPLCCIVGILSLFLCSCTNGPSRARATTTPVDDATFDDTGGDGVGSTLARWVVNDVSLRSMTGSDPEQPQAVVVDAGRIIDILPAAEVTLSPEDVVIDASGQFLMPGLADMHSHAGTPQEFARYLAYGVTTVRIMHGFEFHLSARDAVEQGSRIGPTLIVASPMMDGDPVAYPELVPVNSAEEARARVEAYHQARLRSDQALPQPR